MDNNNNAAARINPTTVTKQQLEQAAATPPMLPVTFDSIPYALQSHNGWCIWAWHRSRDQRWTKVPYHWVNDKPRRASSTNAATWSDYESVSTRLILHDELKALTGKPSHLGLGFVCSEPFGVTVVDLDNCRDRDTGEMTAASAEIIRRLSSYTEVSPSGTGVKIYLLATKPGPRCKHLKRGIEIYDRVRFVAVTGWHLPGTPVELQSRQAEIDALYGELFPPDPQADENDAAARQTLTSSPGRLPSATSDVELIAKALASGGGDAFARLWHGDTSDQDGDDSAADFALACKLAFWCGPDAHRVTSLLWQSGLVRAKWRQRPKYLADTVARAIAKQRNHYGDGSYVDRNVEEELRPYRGYETTLVPAPKKRCGCPAQHIQAAGTDGAFTIGDGSGGSGCSGDDGLDTDAARAVARQAARETAIDAELRAVAEANYRLKFNSAKCPKYRGILLAHKYRNEDALLDLRCESWACRSCAQYLAGRWKNNFAFRLLTSTNAPKTVFVGTVRYQEWDAFRQRLSRSQSTRRDYFAFDGSNTDATIIVFTTAADVLDSPREIPAKAAAEELAKHLNIYVGKARPISSSRGWRLPPEDIVRTDEYELIGRRAENLGPDVIEKFLAAVGVEIEYWSSRKETPGRLQGRARFLYPMGWTQFQKDWVRQGLMFGYVPGGIDVFDVTDPPAPEPPEDESPVLVIVGSRGELDLAAIAVT